MTTTDHDLDAVDLTDVATWVQLYADMTIAIAALEDRKKAAREHIEAALGDTETGILDGRPVVRWTHVTSTRLDQRKAKALLGDRVDEAMVDTISRRFVLVTDEESA